LSLADRLYNCGCWSNCGPSISIRGCSAELFYMCISILLKGMAKHELTHVLRLAKANTILVKGSHI